MVPSYPVTVLEYLDPGGHNPYADWFDELNAPAAAKVVIGLTRLAQGNYSNVKAVGAGLMECKIDFGPGYRIYFGKDGERLVILLGGGIKRRQQSDIRIAQMRWSDYKKRK
ncbi:MAG: type II toxin-antitoxin system RelE/ParE family toxin [Terriglobales bacterium]